MKKLMSISSLNTDTVAVLLLSLQRICRHLSYLLHALDAEVDSFERLLTQMTLSIDQTSSSSSSSSSSSNNEDHHSHLHLDKNEDFYEQLCDAQLEPKRERTRVTNL